LLLHPSKFESPALAESPREPRWDFVWKRRIAAWSRWLHIYLSMVSFAVLLFFAVTGLTLNHTEWLEGRQTSTRETGALPKEWVHGEVSKLEIVEHLRTRHKVSGAVSDFRVEPEQIAVSLKGPGYTADAFIDRRTAAYELNQTRSGFWAVMNDLHKGRDTGKAWSWVIDLSAVLMTLVSMTGLLLIFYLRKKLLPGLLTLLAGAASCWLVYRFVVP
jgi:hypothetical protein